MTTKRTIALGLAAAAVATLVAVPTFASQGFGRGSGNGQVNGNTDGERPEPTQEMLEHREAMQAEQAEIAAAVESGDYGAWLEAVGDRPIAEEVTADEFARYMEMHNLREQAHALMEQADEIGEELGITHARPGMGQGNGFTRGMGQGVKAHRGVQSNQSE
ncbi:MAG: hypothetical protein V1738_05220 [Patescibacteria group bacterium]